MAVYFIQDERGRVKIGFAQDPLARLETLQAGNAERLFLMRTVQGNLGAECWYHKHFKANRLSREWFEFHGDMLTVQAPAGINRTKRLPNAWMPVVTIDELIAGLKALEEGSREVC